MKLIAKIGSRQHEILHDDDSLPSGYVQLKSPCPSANHIATANGEWQLSYKKEHALILRRMAYVARLDPLVNEYIVKTILNNTKDIAALKKSIIETRTAIQQEYQFVPDNLLMTDGNSE